MLMLLWLEWLLQWAPAALLGASLLGALCLLPLALLDGVRRSHWTGSQPPLR